MPDITAPIPEAGTAALGVFLLAEIADVTQPAPPEIPTPLSPAPTPLESS